MSVTQADILAAMSKVMDPELHIDLVKAGMVKDIHVSGDTAKLKIELTTPACPMKGKIQADSEAALKAVPGLKSFDIEWGARVRPAGGGMPAGALLPQVKNIILVGAGKGGVGKSTVALNLATALAQHGAKVGLLDADFYGPSVPLMTGLGDKRPVSPDGKSLNPLEAHGLKVMSIGFLVEADQALIWRGPMLHGALMQLVRDVNWGELDYLVLDLPPGTGDVALTLSQSVRAAGAVLVTTPQDVALADVVRAKQMFDKVHIPVLGIVENMSQFVCPNCSHTTAIFNHGGGRKAAQMFGIPFLGEIPLDLKVRESGDSGVPVVVGAKDSPEAKAFQEVARNVAGRVSAQSIKSVPLPVMQAR
ncbi:ATP-binding protein, Mrp/Nbp35 family [Myxococcus xanthus DK 1622]|uniref:Iron-sulfur cluster carrier protein n=3 Tax=Myxococcus TaxID=32 RepID=Q1D5T8_MYXXD|nr:MULTISPECIES: iron-sulfur cluster carrier protein ApbC [Myxococcus]ABF91793.1 ATP-binding protein, Mrp/Nbp35 family [Myxococcus xanthus DK 1622]NOJ56030.1 iron-sulfur cluster carrier protein ApbC [Myxococcus xanthus]NOJ76941.1 iron-sulfur cluster carrier protein ApbC [Myxococcus xanthus]NOJ84546.1 iron-sulfur cluster carrier protein ApbC [Myxococcus xanthus]QDE90671.1 chromosome partitioning protein [Myxococcus xanthus]